MSESDFNDLLCCPWCGGTDIRADPTTICYPIQYSATAECSDCGAREPSGSGVHDKEQDAIEEAFKQWNERTT